MGIKDAKKREIKVKKEGGRGGGNRENKRGNVSENKKNKDGNRKKKLGKENPGQKKEK